jgi:hypothetical protein
MAAMAEEINMQELPGTWLSYGGRIFELPERDYHDRENICFTISGKQP